MRKWCAVLSICMLLSSLLSCGRPAADAPVAETAVRAEETAVPVKETASPVPSPTATPYQPTELYAYDGTSRLTLTFTDPETAVLSDPESSVTFLYELSGDTVSFKKEGSGDVLLTGSYPDGSFVLQDAAGYSLSFSESPETVSDAGLTRPSSDGSGLSVTDLFVKNGVVSLLFSATAGSVCFTSAERVPDAKSPDWIPCGSDTFRIFKTDGDYFIYFTDENGEIHGPESCSVVTGLSYDKSSVSTIHMPVSEFLASNGTSLDEINRQIADSAADAGIYSRAGVAAAAVSLVGLLASYQAAVPYQGPGRYADKEPWGIPSKWGTELEKADHDFNGVYHYAGLHCAASTVWAYKQSCLNLVSTRDSLALYGYGRHSGNYRDNIIPLEYCQAGDVLKTSTTHTMMIVDRLDTDSDGSDDAYLVLEMVNPIMTLSVRYFRSIRSCTAYDMSAVFENTGDERRFLDYWPDSYLIPEAEWPEYVRESYRLSPVRLSLAHIKASAGL